MLRTSLMLAAIVCLAVLILAVRSVRLSLEAEKTLHAHLLVMDVVSVYVQNYSQWPRDWDGMYSVQPSRSHGVWDWPSDASEIRQRVIVDFSTSSGAVAKQTPASFSAIRQVFPYYADDSNAVERLIQTCRYASEDSDSRDSVGHGDGTRG